MAYGAYLSLDQTRWIRGDYSSTNKLTGTIYTDKAKSTALNLTGYTVKVRIYKRWKYSDIFNKTATIVTAASGTWSYAVASNEMVTSGFWLVEAELSKTGEVMSTYPVEFEVLESPI